jgi:hypothetical protein
MVATVIVHVNLNDPVGVIVTATGEAFQTGDMAYDLEAGPNRLDP